MKHQSHSWVAAIGYLSFAIPGFMLPAAVQAQGLLRITEVMSNGDIADWFELANYGTAPVNLNSFRMDDNSFSFAASVSLLGISSIAPGEAVVFVESGSDSTLDIFRTNWSLDSSIQIGRYSGSGVSLSSGGDGVTIFDGGGTELPGPFSSLIRVSFGSATSGTTFFWTYNGDGDSTSLSTGTLTSTLSAGNYTTWINGSTTMRGTPGVLQTSSATILNWKAGDGVWLNGHGTDWRAGATPTAWTDSSIAIFGGAAGSVEVADAVSAAQLVFNTPGYTLSGNASLQTSTISAPAAGNTTIAVELTGNQGLTVSATGTVLLQTASTFTGDLAVVGGTLQVGVDNAFADAVVLSAARFATLDFNGKSDTVAGVKGLGTIANFQVLTLNLTGSADSRFDGFLSGSGQVVIDSTGLGRQVFNTTPQTLADFAVKDYTGKTIVRQGTLAINETAFPFQSEAIEIEPAGHLVLTSNLGVYFATNPMVFLGGNLSQEAGESISEIANPLQIPPGQTGTISLVNNAVHNPSFPTTEEMVFSGAISGGGLLSFTASNPSEDRARVVLQNASHSFSGNFHVGSGVELVLTGSASAAKVQLASGSILSGSGAVSRMQGSGWVAPGASPGIFTAQELSPDSLQFAFEFSKTGLPDFSQVLASGNDLLRLKDPGAPFLDEFSSLNTIQVFLAVAEVFLNDEFQGGFFTDRLADFLPQVQGASFEFFVLGDGLGTHAYGGQSYYTLQEFNTLNSSSLAFSLSTLAVSGANFADGITDGRILNFTAVPEPSALGLGGMTILVFSLRELRRRAARPPLR